MSVEELSVVLHHSQAMGTAKVVLLGIANHAGDGGAWPSLKTLARYANVDPRNVRIALRDLEAMGELACTIQQGGGARTPDHARPNRYDVLVQCPEWCDRSKSHRDLRTTDMPLSLVTPGSMDPHPPDERIPPPRTNGSPLPGSMDPHPPDERIPTPRIHGSSEPSVEPSGEPSGEPDDEPLVEPSSSHLPEVPTDRAREPEVEGENHKGRTTLAAVCDALTRRHADAVMLTTSTWAKLAPRLEVLRETWSEDELVAVLSAQSMAGAGNAGAVLASRIADVESRVAPRVQRQRDRERRLAAQGDLPPRGSMDAGEAKSRADRLREEHRRAVGDD